jgi:hypothetical protein
MLEPGAGSEQTKMRGSVAELELSTHSCFAHASELKQRV